MVTLPDHTGIHPRGFTLSRIVDVNIVGKKMESLLYTAL